MNITIGGRGSGRTTELIKACAADKGSVIVCPTSASIKHIVYMAKWMGLDIPEPISFEQFRNGNQGRKVSGYYFDNLDSVLSMMARGAAVRDATFQAQPEDILWLDPTQN